MKEVRVTTTITFKEDGEIIADTKQTAAGILHEGSDAAAGYMACLDDKKITEDEAERYAVVSDLADVCDYLEDSEVIKIKLIIQKAQARKERAEHE